MTKVFKFPAHNRMFLNEQDAINFAIEARSPYENGELPYSPDEVYDLEEDFDINAQDASESVHSTRMLQYETGLYYTEKVAILNAIYAMDKDRKDYLQKKLQSMLLSELDYPNDIEAMIKDALEKRQAWGVLKTVATITNPHGGIRVVPFEEKNQDTYLKTFFMPEMLVAENVKSRIIDLSQDSWGDYTSSLNLQLASALRGTEAIIYK